MSRVLSSQVSPSDLRLVVACEQRLAQRVHVTCPFDLRRLMSPVGGLQPRRSCRVAVALTDEDIWLLELRRRLASVGVGAVLGHFPRRGLVAQFRKQGWPAPRGWTAEFCWPATATYVEGVIYASADAELIIGLLAADELEPELGRSALST
jgi:hypothetical protein